MKFFSVAIFLAVCCATALSESSEESFVKFLSETGTSTTTDPSKKPYHHSQVSRVECVLSAILDGVRLSKYNVVDAQYQEDVKEFKKNVEDCKGAWKPSLCVAKEVAKAYKIVQHALVNFSKANYNTFVEAKNNIWSQCF